jgi:hypothetical protein
MASPRSEYAREAMGSSPGVVAQAPRWFHHRRKAGFVGDY